MKVEGPTNLILVDDDTAVLSALKFAFEVEGFEVRAYRDAESLLSELGSPEFGCMVLDYKLPGLDGLELLTEIRARGVTLPAVLITTPTVAVRDKAVAAHVTLVEKPLQTSALLDAVRSLLHSDAPSAR